MKDPRYYDNGNSKAKNPNKIKYSPNDLKKDIQKICIFIKLQHIVIFTKKE